jgi:uncharacterized protein YraI
MRVLRKTCFEDVNWVKMATNGFQGWAFVVAVMDL